MRSSKPKVLHEFAGKTFLQRVMASVGHLEPETLAVVVHYQADRVSEAARSYDANVDIVNQDDIPGTGRAVQCAMAQLTQERNLHGSVLIAASDMPLLDSVTLKKLVAFHEQSGDGATVLTTILDNRPDTAASSATVTATCCASSSRRTPTGANSRCRR